MADNSGRPPRAKTITLLVLSLVAAGVLAAGLLLPVVGGIGLIARHYAEKFDNTKCNLRESNPPQKTTIYARDGETPIATLFSQDRVPIPLSAVPDYLQDALVATEDRRFFSHHGVDIRGLIRSLITTASGGDTQGGSTLTMQYVKQIRYYQAGDDKAKQEAAISQNINRKIEDAKCALYFEETRHESKDEILDNYLNIAFFGEHSYGIQTAAQTYFNKNASDLSLVESALLVGLLRAPSAYDPFLHPQAAKARRDAVLQNLVDVGKLSQSVANQQMAKPIALATQGPPHVQEGCANANSTIPNVAFFCEYAVNWLKSVDGISDTQLQTGGLKIVTTLDPKLQKSAQRHLHKTIPKKSPMTAVLPAVDPKSGDVLAMATSKKFGTKKYETEQPVFTSHTAQAASTFKLFPLLTALSTGVPSDWPIYTVGNTGDYKTKHCLTASTAINGDANEIYSMQETLQSATQKSSNTYFVALADWLLGCNLDPMVKLAQQLGVNSLDAPSEIKNQTEAQTVVNKQQAQRFVLGFLNASPLEMAGAYAAVANSGKFYQPAPILYVETENHEPLPVKRTPFKQVISPQVADQAAQVLTGDTQSPGTSASEFASWYAKNPSLVAGKTGTMVAVNRHGRASDKNAATWFVGMTPNLVATSALINFTDSNAPSRGLPGQKPGTAYGDYAAGVWLKALQPSLVHQSWTWPDPSAAPGIPVPPVVGQDLATAKQTLSDQGFKMRQLDPTIQCASAVTSGSVAYYAPTVAPRGSTITVCPSLGVEQPMPPPPPPPPPPKHHHGDNGGGNGGGDNGGGNGGGGNGDGGNGDGGGGPGGGNGGGGGPGGGGPGGGNGGGGGPGGGNGPGGGGPTGPPSH